MNICLIINIPEYEYEYLFVNSWDYPLLNPIPYETEGEREKNKAKKDALIKEKILEFQKNNLDISKLIYICTTEKYSSL